MFVVGAEVVLLIAISVSLALSKGSTPSSTGAGKVTAARGAGTTSTTVRTDAATSTTSTTTTTSNTSTSSTTSTTSAATQTPTAAVVSTIQQFYASGCQGACTPQSEPASGFTVNFDSDDASWVQWILDVPKIGLSYGYAESTGGTWQVVAGPGTSAVGCSGGAVAIPAFILGYFRADCTPPATNGHYRNLGSA